MGNHSQSYSPIALSERSSEELHDSCLEKGDIESISDQHRSYRNQLYTKLQLHISGLLFALSILIFLGALLKKPSGNECTRKVSLYSPALASIEYEEHDFVNYFAHQTKYRGPPTTQLEDEWKKLWQYGYINIPEEDLVHLNRSQSKQGYQRLPADLGGGYAALVDVFHQLHCLNTIRQYTWGDYYERHGMPTSLPSDSLVGNRMHVDHCIETLRLVLMCHADTTPVLLELDPKAPKGARADFDAHHKCRNFEKLRGWMDDNVVLEMYPHDGSHAKAFHDLDEE